jgi:hypothetical protein
MVIVLAIVSKVHGFKPGRGDGFLRSIKIGNTPCFGGEVNQEAHVRKKKEKYFARPNSSLP